ncbi:MAG: hypothetical protein JJU36_11285 [Phycisphaeraceae bacterium]|nr:hypothetical protein [Phycisphaeraceae bacterium]
MKKGQVLVDINSVTLVALPVFLAEVIPISGSLSQLSNHRHGSSTDLNPVVPRFWHAAQKSVYSFTYAPTFPKKSEKQ